MSLFDDIGRYGAALRNAHRDRKAIRAMNALPPELQKDIGWPGSPESRAANNIRTAFWKTIV